MQYEIIRSNRKTIALQLTAKGLTVRAPFHATQAQIAEVVRQHMGWIEKHQKQLTEAQNNLPTVEKLTMEEIQALADKALKVIPARVAHFAPLVGVTYGRMVCFQFPTHPPAPPGSSLQGDLKQAWIISDGNRTSIDIKLPITRKPLRFMRSHDRMMIV